MLVATIGLFALQLWPGGAPGARSAIRAAPGQLGVAVGVDRTGAPLSLAPDGTWRALLSLIVPIAAFWGALQLSGERRRLILILPLLGCAAAVLGVLQVASGADGPLYPYATAHRGLGVGWFVNRNHQGVFLCALLPWAALAGASWRGPGGRLAGAAALALLTLGALATGSRATLLLLPLNLTFALTILLANQGRAKLVATGALALALLGWLAAATPRGAQILARFDAAGGDARWTYWENTLYAIGQAMPWGTGFGSFRALYATVQPLDQVTDAVVNHAHSDMLELVLEGGWPVVLVAACGLALLIGATVNGLRDRARWRVVLASAGAIAALLGGSVADYPLRMDTLMALFGLCAGLLLPPAAIAGHMQAWRYTVAGIAGLALGWAVVTSAWASHLLLAGDAAGATRWTPWSSAGWTRVADTRLRAGDASGAARAARRALEISPLDATAARVLGFALAALGHAQSGDAVLTRAAALGWRDLPLQLWLAQRALDREQFAVAVARADAVLRQRPTPAVLARLVELSDNPRARPALANSLAQRPNWRRDFLIAVVDRHGPGLADMIAAVGRAGAPPTQEELAVVESRLLLARDRTVLNALARLIGGGWPRDGGFATTPAGTLPSETGPFAWRAPPLFGATVTVAVPDRPLAGAAVRIWSNGTSAGPVLAQRLLLPPGAHQLNFAVLGKTATPPLSASLACPWSPHSAPIAIPLTRQASTDDWARVSGRFTVPRSCVLQDLRFTIDAGTPVDFSIDSLSVTSSP